ncbi:MAG TPA: M23 family metallopeptidase [Polyangia bacterium]|nr:M23 family metallopeptidase [Polyangia bacterium]
MRLGLLCIWLVAGAGTARLRPGDAAERSPPPQVTRLTLPFAGIWGVIQGFDSGETHRGYAAFALDLVPAQTKGTREPPKGAPLTRFACYGRPVLAPADATVVAAEGSARDWPAHVAGRDPGNYVILQHAPGEYTEFRHLAAASVVVKVGDRVRRGDWIGRCGNSGNAVTPHLHVGFLSSFDPIVTRPMVLSDYQVLTPDGWQAGDGTPRKGQFIRSTPVAK